MRPPDHSADVIVLGGGPAGAWAGLAASQQGARVLVVDKGYLGTSGATAAANTAVIDADAHPAVMSKVIERRLSRGFGLVDASTVERVVIHAGEGLDALHKWGYGFPRDESGRLRRHTLRGPNYMQLLRRQLRREGVTILDHSPAIELLLDDGRVAGVAGADRRSGIPWSARAPAIIIATGGCAFMSGALGTLGLTGDGLLMGAEAGATLSAMEFSGQFGIAHEQSSITKNIIYQWASFTDESGAALEGDDVFEIVGRHLPRGRVFAVIDRAASGVREALKSGQPNIFLAFDRLGVDPFTHRFPVTLRHEGTVRGVGGLLVGAAMQTTVPGLFAAGDAASRELLVGATTGGGGPNATWAIASGLIAGRSAAAYAAGGLPPSREPRGAAVGWVAPGDRQTAIQASKNAVSPFLHDAPALLRAKRELAEHWQRVEEPSSSASIGDRLKGREASAMLAAARWIVEAALLRDETRGMHRRSDHPNLAAGAPTRITLSGVHAIVSQTEGRA